MAAIRCDENTRRFPHPDWSIADKWVAKELLRRGAPPLQIHTILRLGSPGFPRRHSDPDDYLRRTLACAARELHPVSVLQRAARPGFHGD